MPSLPTVSVVIPVKNEARNLPAVLASLPPWISEVVLIDGQSVDDTVAVAKECYPDIKIIPQMGEGKGDALRVGFAACTSDIIVMIDGDGSTDGAEIIRFVAALLAGADYAKGSRFSNSGGSDDITPHRRWVPGPVRPREPGAGHPVHRSVLWIQRVLGPASFPHSALIA